ncbi:MAG TPA: TraR/DksA C4-type zinc finger protein [Bacilli bacterium]
MKLTEKQIRRLKQRLLAEKAEIKHMDERGDHFGLSGSFRDSTGELSVNDNHPGDAGTEMFERGKDIALNERNEERQEEIERALAAMENGTYGICAACGKHIPYQRLKALPTARYCIEHVPDPGLSGRRPAEERYLRPPFGRTSFDKRDDETEFDGEDAWQVVEQWGTANTPAMAEDPDVYSYDNLYIESDENDGYVEPLESFLATDITGNHVLVVRNNEYRKYIARGEGDDSLKLE